MNIKNYIKQISIIITISFLFTQNLNLFTQKITLENSLRDKIYSEVGRVIDKNKFVVVVNLELGKYGDLVSPNKTQEKNYNSRGMEYLPGVPLSGSKGLGGNTAPKRRAGANDYVISEIDIAIYLEQSLANAANERTIESLIKDIIPQTSQCDDCITVETMNFQNQSEETEVSKLRKELESLKEADRKRELTELNLQLADLKAQLVDSESERISWEEYQRRQDSTRLAKFEEQDQLKKQELETTLTATQNKLDTVINDRIESETQTKNDLIDIISGKSKRDDDFLGMQVPRSSSSNTMIILGIVLIIIIVIALLIFNRKSVVYLKPKDSNDNSNNNTNDSNEPENNNVSTKANNANVTNDTPPSGSSASLDDSVISSELKALRQSSIAMSASQKEGATQIIKDWMSDGGSNNNEEQSAESNEEGE